MEYNIIFNFLYFDDQMSVYIKVFYLTILHVIVFPVSTWK